MFVVLQKCPKLFETVQLSRLIVTDRFFLKDRVEVAPEILFQAIRKVAEKTLETVTIAGLDRNVRVLQHRTRY